MHVDELFRMLQHGDSQFPSGGFAFSFGLEGAFADEQLRDRALVDLLSEWLTFRWATYEQVFVVRAAERFDNVVELVALDHEVEATMLAPAERSGSRRSGTAMLTTYVGLNLPEAGAIDSAVRRGDMLGHRSVIEGSVWAASGLEVRAIRVLSAYSFASTLGTALMRLGLYGAMSVQSALSELNGLMTSLVTAPAPDAQSAPTSFNPIADVALLRAPMRDHALFAN